VHGYTCTMSVRLHVLVTERQRECLAREADRTGLPVAELVRRAIDGVYRPEVRPRAGGLELSVGIWRRPDAAIVGRRPGIRLVD
jgi:hypothetical protein